MRKVAAELGLTLEVAENLGYANIKPVLQDLASRDFDLVICHASGYATMCTEAARELGLKVGVITHPQGVTPGLVGDIWTYAQEGAYLAGVLAGHMTRSGVVGIVVSAEPPTWNYMTVGFAEGLHSVRPDARLLYGVIGQANYEDAAGGRRLVESQIASGADVIFGMGNGATYGMMQAIGRARARDGGKVWFIDVIGDKRGADQYGIVLSSVLFDYTNIYKEMIRDVMNGTFGRTYVGNLANGGVRLLEFPDVVPQAAREAVQKAMDDIISGRIKVSAIPNADGVRQRLSELFPR